MKVSMTFCKRLVVAGLLLTIGVGMVMAESMRSGNPPDGLTGAPGEGNCTQCHSGTVNSGDGDLTINALSSYEPNQTYTITVTLADPGQQRWGFELTAVDELGDGVGSFTVTDATNTQLSDNAAPGRDYMKHTSNGTFAGTADGPTSWEFEWTAPSTDVGEITLYAAGNAANNNGGTSGDYIYTTSAAMSVASPPVAAPSMSWIGWAVLVMALIIAAVSLRGRRWAV